MHSVFFWGEFPSILNKLLWQIFTPGGSKYQGFAGRERVGEVVLSHQLWCFPNVWETCTPLPPNQNHQQIGNKSWYSIFSFCGPFKVRGGTDGSTSNHLTLDDKSWAAGRGSEARLGVFPIHCLPGLPLVRSKLCQVSLVFFKCCQVESFALRYGEVTKDIEKWPSPKLGNDKLMRNKLK